MFLLNALHFVFVTALAASVPHTEIVGKGDYFRFGMRDSLAVEASFLQVIPLSIVTCPWFLNLVMSVIHSFL